MKKKAFTLVELLVVISIIALLLAVLMPSLNKARESAKSTVCKNHLRTLLTANFVYANEWSGKFVPVIDESMAINNSDTFVWNTNPSFRKTMALNSKTTATKYVMPPDYWCPSDKKVRDEAYWAKINSWRNRMSYAYNMSDRGSDSKNPFNWAANGGALSYSMGRYVGCKVTEVVTAAKKVMFVDGGDFWTEMKGADYIRHWDRFKDDIDKIRSTSYSSAGKMTSSPVMYRHSEGANIGYFDGHSGYSKKQDLFFYLADGKNTTDIERNTQIWFADPKNGRSK
jgi:prepilin-type N-terminal cleavage/methylation domain-containing protein/prepilin-type processing-associated H-X9-DG protein